MGRSQTFPLGAAASVEELDAHPHTLLAQLREHEPVSWVPALRGWIVTRYDLALQVMRDHRSFTVDDPGFSTAQVVGPSMLSLDGTEHARHREPFVPPFRLRPVRDRFTAMVAEEADRLIDRFAPDGRAELRRGFAGPLAAATITHALGLSRNEVDTVLGWYDAIVAAVTDITEGSPPPVSGEEAFEALRERLRSVIASCDQTALIASCDQAFPVASCDQTSRITSADQASLLAAVAESSDLTVDQIVSNAAVLLFGGIETTEGMIATAALALLEHPAQLEAARRDPGELELAIEESLRLEPAAAMIDRYATTEVELGGARILPGELIHISITAANRDPAVFSEPDEFDPHRANVRRHLAFAQGAHVCVGVHLARLEARLGVEALLRRLPGLRLDPNHQLAARGLVFRKPPALHIVWN
jgi:cytochrome P450